MKKKNLESYFEGKLLILFVLKNTLQSDWIYWKISLKETCYVWHKVRVDTKGGHIVVKMEKDIFYGSFFLLIFFLTFLIFLCLRRTRRFAQRISCTTKLSIILQVLKQEPFILIISSLQKHDNKNTEMLWKMC